MAIGEARARWRALRGAGPIEILDKHGKRRAHPLWQRVAEIAKPGERAAGSIVNSGGCRPYIDYQRTTPQRWAWRLDHRAREGELFDIGIDARARGLIVLEPSLKASASPNKQWGRWQELIDAYPQLPWAQLGNQQTRWLRGVVRLPAASFEAACAVLRACRFAVLPEGGLHHAAAALGVRAIVLFGPYMPPSVTGYVSHINLAVNVPDAQGWRVPHAGCEIAWRMIAPELIIQSASEREWL